MKPIHTVISVLVIAVIIALFSSVYIVNEGEQALVLRLGSFTKNANGAPQVFTPGIHVKIPLLDTVKIFDTRIQELVSQQPLRVVTLEQTYLLVEYYAKWRIADLNKFYTSTAGSVDTAVNLLELKINDVIRAEYGKHTSDQAISIDRAKMMANILEQAAKAAKDEGAVIVDVRIKQIALPKEVISSVFSRMETERKQVAASKRATGKQQATEISAQADQQATIIRAEAQKTAADIRAQGEQKAAEIYANAFGKDPRFYSFYRSMEAYKNSFNSKDDVLVLKPEGQFFGYFANAEGGAGAESRTKTQHG